jgi:hypothetical protein
VNNKSAFPDALKRSYKPFQIYSESAAKDVELVKLASQKGDKPGLIWVDPESDYDMKVIRVDPVTTIEYENAKGEPELRTSIKQFVKNRTKFTFSNGATFSLSISKNKSDVQVFEDISDYTFENWNYENKQINNTNTFTINIWSKTAPIKYNKNYYQWPIQSNLITQIATQSQSISYYYSIKKVGEVWYFGSNYTNFVKNGDFRLEDKTGVRVENGIITRWYYIYDEVLKGPNTGLSLPTFGIERSIIINYERDTIDVVDKNIPIWRLKTDDRYTSSVIIEPTQITNNFLTGADLFIKSDKDYYGHGSIEDPQDLGIIKRYALTDLDEESYYIIEGVLKTDNEFTTDDNGNRTNNGGGKGGGGWYRLPHAIGACSVFIRLLIDIGVRLLPKIAKLLALFQNPSKFVTDIMAEKLSNNFEFLSKDAISTFQKANELKSQVANQNEGLDNINELINKTRLDARKLQDKIITDSSNKSSLEQSNASKIVQGIQEKTEEKIKKLEEVGDKKKQLVKKLKDYYKESILSNYVYVDESNLQSIFTLDGSATTPLKVFGADLSFGLASNMANLPNKPPIELIFPNTKGIFKNVQYLIKNTPEIPKNTNQPLDNLTKQEIGTLNTSIKSQLSNLDKQPPYMSKTLTGNTFSDKVQIKFQDGTFEYIPSNSLQSFVKENENRYNFIYVTEGLGKTLTDVNNLLQAGTQNDLDKAKELLDQAKKDFPDNSVVDDKIKDLQDINTKNAANTQPLLKTLLGFIKFPIKVIADIIKWMMDFFASLTNPMTLASKMKEFLSFQWILKFFTPTGILDIFGLKFNPVVLTSFAAGASAVSGKLPNLSGVPHAQSTISNSIKSSVAGSEGMKADLSKLKRPTKQIEIKRLSENPELVKQVHQSVITVGMAIDALIKAGAKVSVALEV